MLTLLCSFLMAGEGLKRITVDEIQYSHMGQLIIDRRGDCYASFLQNYGTGGEKLRSGTSEVTLAKFSLDRALSDDFCPGQTTSPISTRRTMI